MEFSGCKRCYCFTFSPPPPNGLNSASGAGLQGINTLSNSSGSSQGGFIQQITRLSEEEAVAQGYTVIKTAQDLDNIRNNPSGKYILMNDIDLSSYANWDPIDYFKGTLDGNGYIIRNLTIERYKDYVGFFSSTSSSTIQNLGFENANIKGGSYIGGIAGRAANILNCYVSGNITGNKQVGGLAGQNVGDISNCYATGTVSGNEIVGGLVGKATSAITNSYTSNTVTGAGDETGGLAGNADGRTISNCYTDGVVNSTGTYTGGITGGGGATIKNSFTTASITGTAFTGGISGKTSYISNCYAAGKISGGNLSGGIAGSNAFEIKDCIVDKEKTGYSQIIGINMGGTSSNNKALATAEMQNQNNWKNWDNTIWDFSSYPPKLKWQEGLKTPTDPSPPTDPDEPNNPGGGGNTPPVTPEGSIRLQIGADSTGTSVIYVDTSFDIGAFDVDFSSAYSCAAAIEDIDEVLSRINTKRSEFGAVINRLSSVLESQTTTIQNFTSAKSTIMDADIANESADFVKNQILQQTSSALLAQSQNLHASIVLSLIG